MIYSRAISSVCRLIGLALLSMSAASVSVAEEAAVDPGTPKKSAGCPDAKLFSGKLITDICWDCMFPITTAGAEFFSDKEGLENGGKPPGSSGGGFVCACEDNLGIPQPGFKMSMWEPAFVFEVVRQSGCSPVLGGARLPYGHKRRQGGPAIKGGTGMDRKGFHHYHMYSFPLLALLKLFMEDSCNSGGFIDFGLMYPSELDPTFNNDELAFFTHPEAAAVANAAAVSSCRIDAASATLRWPIDQMFWCAGSWGTLYPFSGNTTGGSNFAKDTSLITAKALASLHRRGLAWKTTGADTMCKGRIWPTLVKSQYKLTFFSPVAEATSSHRIGQYDIPWSSGKKIPGAGEDATIIVFRYNDCCVVF